jgi:tRNA(Ile)-lysidine synthase
VVRRLHLTPIPGESLEATAREARYRALADMLRPGDLMLTAHNQDDQAETLLLALLRGSGVHGLAAMPREAGLGRGRLVRPLLDVPRATLEQYVRSFGLSWIEDPSNASLRMDRNYLRNSVVPLLRARWPGFSATLSRSAGHCAEAAQLVDGLAAELMEACVGAHPGTLGIRALGALERSRARPSCACGCVAAGSRCPIGAISRASSTRSFRPAPTPIRWSLGRVARCAATGTTSLHWRPCRRRPAH